MSTQEAQFLMVRKRKRQVAIDPCLGFYCNIDSLAASNTPAVISTAVISENACNEDATDHPGWTPLLQDLPSKNELDHCTETTHEPSDLSSEPELLTVEAFLRRNVLKRERIHVRKYGRKYRNRRIIQSDDEYNEDDRPRSPETSGQVKERQDHFSHTYRLPLCLRPIERLNDDSAKPKPKPRAIRLWNTANAKGVPFRASSFSTATKTKKELIDGSFGTQYHPLNTWNTFRRHTRGNGKSHKPLKAPGSLNRKHSARCAPLNFVPLADVEEAYNKKFHTNSLRGNNREVIPPSDHGQKPQRPVITPLSFVPADHREIVTPNQSCSFSSSNVQSAISMVSGDVPEPALEVPKSLPLTSIAPMTQSSPSFSKETSSDKCLKPLGSFLEGFIERVRAATQAEEANASRSQYQLSTQSLVVIDPISDYGLEQTLLTNYDLTPGCSDEARRLLLDQSLICHPDYLPKRIDQFMHASPSDAYSQEEYVPPPVTFDINAALLAYTQAGNSYIQ